MQLVVVKWLKDEKEKKTRERGAMSGVGGVDGRRT
jgi:hypothetical protein